MVTKLWCCYCNWKDCMSLRKAHRRINVALQGARMQTYFNLPWQVTLSAPGKLGVPRFPSLNLTNKFISRDTRQPWPAQCAYKYFLISTVWVVLLHGMPLKFLLKGSKYCIELTRSALCGLLRRALDRPSVQNQTMTAAFFPLCERRKPE